jgi:hypothetical protein
MVCIEVSHQDAFFWNWDFGEESGKRLCPAWGVEVVQRERRRIRLVG